MQIDSVTIPNGLKNERVPAKKKITPDNPADLFALHSLMGFIGSRGSGKTNACVLLLRRYLDYGSFNRVFVISPTFDSNSVFDVLPVLDEDVYREAMNTQSALQDILHKIEEDARDFDMWEKYSKVYDKYIRNNKSEDVLTAKELMLLRSMHYEKPESMERPSPVIVIDDMSHSDIYSTSRTNPFVNLCLRHRHVHKVGVTIMMLVQNFRSGMPKCMRQNLQQFFIWKTHDETQLEAIASELGSLVSKEQFLALYHRAVDDDPHDFLTVDMNASEELRFRKNFDEVLILY